MWEMSIFPPVKACLSFSISLQLSICLPEACHSHSAIESQGRVFIVGGLNANMSPLSTVYCVSSCSANHWTLSELNVSYSIPR